MIDRYHLRYFLAVIDTGNFSRAAAACNVSQPTLSVGIAKLERQLGAPLFHRSSKRVELTDAGGRLASQARAIEESFARAERTVAGNAMQGTLRLGVLTSTPRRWIEDALQRSRLKRDGTRIELVEGRERELTERLARGRVDVALTILRGRDDRFRSKLLFSEGYALALPISHRLAAAPTIRAEELVNEPMIVRRHCEALSETSRFFTARGVRPFFAARTTNDDRALSYVRAGLAITMMPACFRDPAIARPLLEGFELRREIGWLYARHMDPATGAGESLVDSFADIFASEADF